MNRISVIADRWLGLCRKPPAVRVSQTYIGNRPEPVVEGRPDGGAGGSAAIRRGIGSALSGMRTLNRNRQLLWFTLLAGLVLVGNAIGHAALYIIEGNWQPDHFVAGEAPVSLFGLDSSHIISHVLDFFIAFATLFCLLILLAGLVLSISSKKQGPVSFFEGLTGAKKFLKPIFLWSVVLALAGMLLIRIFILFPVSVWPQELQFLHPFAFTGMLSQFPFNFNLDPNYLTELPGYGGRSLLLWIYPFGFNMALIDVPVDLFLLILTPFVVPFVVLEQKTLREAVAGSLTMMKKILVEASACAAFFGVIAFGLYLTYLLVQAAHGMVTPPEIIYARPTDAWIALGFLYDLALFIVAFVVATVGGIAALDLYNSAKSREIAGSPELRS